MMPQSKKEVKTLRQLRRNTFTRSISDALRAGLVGIITIGISVAGLALMNSSSLYVYNSPTELYVSSASATATQISAAPTNSFSTGVFSSRSSISTYSWYTTPDSSFMQRNSTASTVPFSGPCSSSYQNSHPYTGTYAFNQFERNSVPLGWTQNTTVQILNMTKEYGKVIGPLASQPVCFFVSYGNASYFVGISETNTTGFASISFKVQNDSFLLPGWISFTLPTVDGMIYFANAQISTAVLFEVVNPPASNSPPCYGTCSAAFVFNNSSSQITRGQNQTLFFQLSNSINWLVPNEKVSLFIKYPGSSELISLGNYTTNANGIINTKSWQVPISTPTGIATVYALLNGTIPLSDNGTFLVEGHCCAFNVKFAYTQIQPGQVQAAYLKINNETMGEPLANTTLDVYASYPNESSLEIISIQTTNSSGQVSINWQIPASVGYGNAAIYVSVNGEYISFANTLGDNFVISSISS